MSLPNYKALVLNADFQPLRIHPLSIISFRDAMSVVARDRAIVLETYDAEFRSGAALYKPPSVIALKTYIRIPERAAYSRLNIFLRDDFRCAYCGKVFSAKELTFDHVIPRCKGGLDTPENVVSACAPCNSTKGDKPWVPLYPPRKLEPRELARKAAMRKEFIKNELHADFFSYLYWSGVLNPEDVDPTWKI